MKMLFSSLYCQPDNGPAMCTYEHGLAGYFVSRLKRCPWPLGACDLWRDSIPAVGVIKNGTIARALLAIEHFVYRKVDSESRRHYMEAHLVRTLMADRFERLFVSFATNKSLEQHLPEPRERDSQ